MARLDPAQYRPILSYHFQVMFSTLNEGEFVTYAKGLTLPSMTNNPIKVDYGNTYMHLKGKTFWNPITMTFYALSKPTTTNKLWDYINKHQTIKDGKDAFKSDYIGDIQLALLNPDETQVGTWKLINAFISEISFGDMDWSNEEIVTPEITFVYDYPEWTPAG